jgi:hypothetical protein
VHGDLAVAIGLLDVLCRPFEYADRGVMCLQTRKAR